jgi:transposase
VEGTISQAVRRTDFRHTRYIGKAKTHLQHVLSAAAINLRRITDYLTNLETQTISPIPFVSQRRTAFVALASAP